MTHHTDLIMDHPHIEVHQLTTPLPVDHNHVHTTNPQGEICIGHTHIPSRSRGKPHLKKNPRVKIEDPHMDYYSSGDHSSDSGEEVLCRAVQG